MLKSYKHFGIILLCAWIYGAGCGYQFAGSGTFPGNVKQVFITTFENRTGEIGLENRFSNDLIFEFIRNGSPVAKNRTLADAVLSGTVASLRLSSISHRDTSTSLERQVTITLNLELANTDGSIIWSAQGVSDSEDYPVASEKASTDQNREAAISELSKRLAEKIYLRLTERF